MKGLIFEEVNHYPRYSDDIKESISSNLERVNLKNSGLNHRDVWITQGKYPGITLPVILGSDGAGTINNREVIINPNIGWGENSAYQESSYQILGMPTNGTFTEFIHVEPDRLHDIPLHLSLDEAAALPLNGLTAYRAVFTKGQVGQESTVLIHGIGGGVALMALQFCVSLGAKVYVTSSSEEKIGKAIEWGAKGGVRYKQQDWHLQLGEQSDGLDVIIDGAAGDGVGRLIKICNMGARYVIYGGTRGKINNVSPQLLFWKQMTIHGSTMGNDQEFKEMIDFVSLHKIRPIIDTVMPLSEAAMGFERMAQGLHFGKIIFINDQ